MKGSVGISVYLAVASVLLYGAVQSSPLVYAVASSNTDLDRSPASQYLEDLFRSVEDSGRKPNSKGEINLLKDESQGFANIVQTLSMAVISQNNNRRLLSFNLNQENIILNQLSMVCLRIVVSVPPQQPLFKVNAYLGADWDTLVDSGTSEDRWIDLNIAVINESHQIPLEQRSNYYIGLEIVQLEDAIDSNAILNSLTQMLVMYSYDSNLLENIFQADSQSNNINKRSIPESSLADKLKQPCQRYTQELQSYYDLGLNPRWNAVDPATPSFDYCYGYCKSDTVEEREEASPHSQLVGLMDPALASEGIVPCCIPKERMVKKFETTSASNPSIVTLFTVETIVKCGCF